MTRSGAALAAVLLSLALSATASANSYCVAPATGCTDTASSLQDALTQAATHAGDDSISLGAATYAEDSLIYNPADGARVSITGAGQDATTIQPASSTNGALTLQGQAGPVDLSALTVRTGGASSNIGLQLFYGGNLDRVHVLAADGAVQPTGIEDFRDSTVTNSRFDIPGAGKCFSGGGSGTIRVLDSTLTGCALAVQANATRLFAQRLRILDVQTGIDVLQGRANLDDSLVTLRRTDGWAARAEVSAADSTLYVQQCTLLGAGGGVGVAASNQGTSGASHVEVYDSIIRGFATALSTDSSGSGHPADINADINDYDGVISSGVSTNHVHPEAPLFVDAAGGDYHLQAGSPLLDLDDFPIYTDVGESATDLDGSLRIINGKRDLGAFERALMPGASTGAATDVTQTTATVPATANAGGAKATVRFVYGPTASYGSEMQFDPLAASLTDQAFSISLVGLAPGTTYHYALVVTNSSGTTTSPDQTLTTGSPPVQQPPPPVVKAALSRLKVSPSRFKAAKKGATFARTRTGAKVTFTLSAAGTVRLTVLKAKRVRGHTRWVKVGKAIARAGNAGANTLRFSGRVRGKRLKPGRYRLQSLDPSGATQRAGFSIVRR